MSKSSKKIPTLIKRTYYKSTDYPRSVLNKITEYKTKGAVNAFGNHWPFVA